MRKTWFTYAVVVVMAALSSAAVAERFAVPETSVSFEAPAGFTPLTDDEIKVKYLSSRAPRFVLGNASRGTTIAYDIKPNKIPDSELEKAMAAFEQMFTRIIPGIVWKRRDIVQRVGQRWIELEATSNAIDTDIHNVMLITPYEGKMLMFNFNSTKEQFPKFERELRISIESIRLK